MVAVLATVTGLLSFTAAATVVPSPASAAGTVPVVPVAVGELHSCALTTSAGVACWGANRAGQLGNGSTTEAPTPVPVTGLDSGVAALAAGGLSDYMSRDASGHTCALTKAGGVKCWGANGQGQLGNGSTTASNVPVDVTGLASGVTAIAAGGNATCALTAAGSVTCWGRIGNQRGPATSQSTVPVEVPGLSSGMTAVATSGTTACVVGSGGAARCWGENWAGQLGNGTTNPSPTPVAVTGLESGVESLATGQNHTCAVTTAGATRCWGHNGSGQLGNGTETDQRAPSPVTGMGSGARAVTVSGSHSCALSTTGAVSCWGYNASAQLGNGSLGNSNVPLPVTGMQAGITAISTSGGSYHTCAHTATGTVRCWGASQQKQLGNANSIQSLTPKAVKGLGSGVTAIAAANSHTCAVVAGEVKCWGANYNGQLGNGTRIQSTEPVTVVGLTDATAVALSQDTSCALLATGTVKCWGQAGLGGLGNGSTGDVSTVPVSVTGLTGVTSIESGSYWTCAIAAGGALMCWGANFEGNLGSAPQINPTPIEVMGYSADTVAVGAGSAGGAHNCAVDPAGGARCLGQNNFGQLGTTNDGGDVVGLPGALTDIDGGMYHSCALTVDQTVWCWGANHAGQMGTGDTADRPAPTQMQGASNVTLLEVGTRFECMVASGAVKCLGEGYYGNLGNGTRDNSSVPVGVVGLSSGVTALAAGSAHACAVTGAGGAVCWGDNEWGRLGDPTAYEPGEVIGGAMFLVPVPPVPAPRLTISDATVLEPDPGQPSTSAAVPVALSKPATSEITVRYYTTDGSATAGIKADYTAWGKAGAPRTQRFPAGSTWMVISPPVRADSLVEATETFAVHILSAVAADGSEVDISDGAAQVEILDNQSAAANPVFMVHDLVTAESDRATGQKVQLSIQFSKPTTQAVELRITFVDGTAQGGPAAPYDYLRSSVRTLKVPAGARSRTLAFKVWGDIAVEDDEVLTVTVVPVDGSAFVAAKTSANVVLVDDDA